MSHPLSTYTFVSLGRELTFRGPANLADLEKIVGEGEGIKAYMRLYGYERNRPVYEKLVEKVEAHTGEKRAHHINQGKKDAEKEIKVYDETEKKFIDRMIAAKKITQEEVDAYHNEVNQELGDWSYDPTTSRKPAQKFYDLADDALLKIENKVQSRSGTIASEENYKAGFEKKLGIVWDSAYGEFNRDNLARAFKDVELANQRKLADSVLG